MVNWVYNHTLYKSKKLAKHERGEIYAGHGSFIILTKAYFERCGKIDYPVFLFCEEIWLAEKCRQAGLKVVYDPRMTIYDSEHVSIGKMPHDTYCRLNYDAVQYIIKTFY